MTLYQRPRYPAWYQAVRRECLRRAHFICEVKGCGACAVETHHLCYPVGRREEPRDLQAVCRFHHWWLHHFDLPAANDNEEAEQLELRLQPANDNAPGAAGNPEEVPAAAHNRRRKVGNKSGKS